MDQAAQFAEKVANLDSTDDVVSQQVTIFGSTYSVDATMMLKEQFFGLLSDERIQVTMLANDEEVASLELREDTFLGYGIIGGAPAALIDSLGSVNIGDTSDGIAPFLRRWMSMAHDRYHQEK